MITKEILELLQKNIKQYDKMEGKDYLIAFSKGKNSPCEVCEITFYHFNYWHLMGCKLIGEDSLRTYLACKNGGDISKDVEVVHTMADVYKKSEIFGRLFDFISHAKEIRIGYTDKGPEQFEFTMGLGNQSGIVLYGTQKSKALNYLIPKSVQEKRLNTVSSNCSKIIFIISKVSGEADYNNIEYEIKSGVYDELKDEISEQMKNG